MIKSGKITTWIFHDPTLKNLYGKTVAMYAAGCGYIKDLPREFYHDPTLKDLCGETVAMHAIGCGYIKDLPKEFYHDPTIKNNFN